MGVVAREEAQGSPAEAPSDPSRGLQPLLDLVADDMREVNRIILDKAVSDVELIPKLAHHLIDSGGKRLRPMLTIAAARLWSSPSSVYGEPEVGSRVCARASQSTR